MSKNTITYPMPNTKESRAGAMACLEGIKEVEKITDETLSSCATTEQHFQMFTDSQQAMIRSGGLNLSPFMAGYLGALGEYISTYKLVGEPWVANGWKPWAAMTKKEEEADKKQLCAD